MRLCAVCNSALGVASGAVNSGPLVGRLFGRSLAALRVNLQRSMRLCRLPTMKLFSLSRAAELLQVDKSTISRACARYGIGCRVDDKPGGPIVLTSSDIEQLRKLIAEHKPGNPEFTRQAAAKRGAAKRR